MYEIKVTKPKLHERHRKNGEIAITGHGFKTAMVIPFYFPENPHPDCVYDEQKATAVAEVWIDALSVQDFISAGEGVAG